MLHSQARKSAENKLPLVVSLTYWIYFDQLILLVSLPWAQNVCVVLHCPLFFSGYLAP